jgi:hypothetical protein
VSAFPTVRAKAFIAATAALAAGPICVELLFGGKGKKFVFVASDVFYYLTVARNVVTVGRVSFDGERLTNGFHPLWQAMCVVAVGVTRLFRMDDGVPVMLTLLLGAALLVLAVWALGLALLDDEGSLSPAILIVPFGFGTCLYAPIALLGWEKLGRVSSSLWGAVNGMESALAIAAYSCLAAVCVRANRHRHYPLLLGLALSTLAMARLDHAIFSITIGAGLIAFDKTTERRKSFIAVGIFLTVLCLYAAINKAAFGLAMPISGALKSTFPDVTPSNRKLLEQMLSGPTRLPITHAQRALQIIIPSIFAFVHVCVGAFRLFRKGRPERRIDLFLFLSASAVLGLALYNFCFVPKLNQGFWYFPVSFFYVSVYVIRLTDGLFARLGSRMAAGAGIACAVATLLGYLWVRPSSSDSSRAEFFYEEAPKIRAFYGSSPPKILEYDDGIITYATGFRAMSGMGLTLDAGAIEAAGGIGAHRTNRNSLLELALERGFNRFCTFSYPGRPRLTSESSDRDIRNAYAHLIGRQGRRFVFHVEYASSDGALSIVEARRRGDS